MRVSLVCFSSADDNSVSSAHLDGQSVDEIYADLTARSEGTVGIDLTAVRRLAANSNIAFIGDAKHGAFDVSGDQAREWLRLPANPNGRTNADVLKPWRNGMDLTRRPAGKWIVDFGWQMFEADAALYEEPFRWVQEHVYPFAPPQPPHGLPQALVATRRAETGHVASAEGASAVHCNAAGRQAQAVRLVRLADLPRFLTGHLRS